MVHDYPARYERDVPGLKTMKRHYDIKTIQEAVAAEAKIQITDLSTARYRAFLHPRKVGVYLCRMFTGATAREIANAFGLRSDSNVAAYSRQIEETDDLVKRVIRLLEVQKETNCENEV